MFVRMAAASSKVDVEQVPAKQRPQEQAEQIMMPTAKVLKAKGSVATAVKAVKVAAKVASKGAMRPPEPLKGPPPQGPPPRAPKLQPAPPKEPPKGAFNRRQPDGPPPKAVLEQHAQRH